MFFVSSTKIFIPQNLCNPFWQHCWQQCVKQYDSVRGVVFQSNIRAFGVFALRKIGSVERPMAGKAPPPQLMKTTLETNTSFYSNSFCYNGDYGSGCGVQNIFLGTELGDPFFLYTYMFSTRFLEKTVQTSSNIFHNCFEKYCSVPEQTDKNETQQFAQNDCGA